MCQNCKSSELGIARQAELAAATEQCKEVNINPAIVGFIVKHAYQGRVPGHERQNATQEQVAAAQRYIDAVDAMKTLHNDYVFDRGRRHAEEMRARGVKPFYITHGDKR